MITIVQNQALQRWDSLPDSLREALSSEINSDFIWKTCRDEHIPDEKIYAVARIAGYVLMGFVHPDDASKEIRDATGIDVRIADSIMSAISARIFAPLRQTIDGIYEPSSKSWLESKLAGSIGEPTMIIKEIAVAPSTPQKPVQQVQGKSAPSASSQPSQGFGGQAGQTPQPVILQESPYSGMSKKASDFHIEISDDKMKGLSTAQRFAPVKLAVLELGEDKGSAPSAGSSRAGVGAKYEGEFGSFSSLPKISKEKSGGLTSPSPEKNRTVTEIISPIPAPIKNLSEQIIPKPLLSEVPNPSASSQLLQGFGGQAGQVPPKPTVTSIPAPVQISIKVPAEQIKVNSPPAPIVQPIKISQFASAKSSGEAMLPTPTVLSALPKEPIKSVVVQRNYSEANVIPKPSAPPRAPLSNFPQESLGAKIPAPAQLPAKELPSQIKTTPIQQAPSANFQSLQNSSGSAGDRSGGRVGQAPVPVTPAKAQQSFFAKILGGARQLPPLKFSEGKPEEQVSPVKPMIRKDYSEDDLIQKTSTSTLSPKIPAPASSLKVQTPSQMPIPKIPVPPKKN